MVIVHRNFFQNLIVKHAIFERVIHNVWLVIGCKKTGSICNVSKYVFERGTETVGRPHIQRVDGIDRDP
jgi:hypothetical protein